MITLRMGRFSGPVLGDFSQGAAVTGFVTSPSMPAGIDPVTASQPLDPQVANHVVVVGLFGTPNVRTMSFLNQPPVSIRPV